MIFILIKIILNSKDIFILSFIKPKKWRSHFKMNNVTQGLGKLLFAYLLYLSLHCYHKIWIHYYSKIWMKGHVERTHYEYLQEIEP